MYVDRSRSLQDVSISWPSWSEVFDVLTLGAGFNSAVVIIGATALGIAAGIIGTFAVLRKRALMSDALAHSALPGLAAAFIIAVSLGYEGKSLPILLFGATVSGVLGVLAVLLLVGITRLGEDVAIGAVLSVFFGAGIVLLSVVQTLNTGNEGGLQYFIYGQTAALRLADALLIAISAAFAVCAAILFLKEFRLVCFDQEFAAVQGWPVTGIDVLLMSLVVVVTVIGLQTVGLILIIALLIIPAASARFWTERLSVMTALGGLIGGVSGYLGASLSALLPRLPAGAVIVLTAGLLFFISFLFAPRRGLLAAAIRLIMLRLKIGRDHLLRSMFEMIETHGGEQAFKEEFLMFPLEELRIIRGWGWFERFFIIAYVSEQGLIKRSGREIGLTQHGWQSAARLTRNHRLWEEYLVCYGSLSPTHVDYSADIVEHVLSAELVVELEEALRLKGLLPEGFGPMPSLHPLEGGG